MCIGTFLMGMLCGKLAFARDLKVILVKYQEKRENSHVLPEFLEEKGGSFALGDFEIIYQMPELPTGCEITALTMVLNYYGWNADKMDMAMKYLPRLSADFWKGEDGKQYGNDMEHFFIGDPSTKGGYICGVSAIAAAADAFLEDRGSPLRAVDLTGASPEQLYHLVSQGTPVVVWVTIGMKDLKESAGWYTEDGRFMEWHRNDHGAVLIGYGKNTVTIADPISGYVEYSREQFEMRTHKRLIDILRPSNKTVEALQGLELPAGVELEIKL